MQSNDAIGGTLDAYSSIGMIAVFFASLSLTILSNADLEGASTLETVAICIMSGVLVLNVFTVLTMSMIYYYGQLHIGHGMSETAAYFVQRNKKVRILRRLSCTIYRRLCVSFSAVCVCLMMFGREHSCWFDMTGKTAASIVAGCVLGVRSALYDRDGPKVSSAERAPRNGCAICWRDSGRRDLWVRQFDRHGEHFHGAEGAPG